MYPSRIAHRIFHQFIEIYSDNIRKFWVPFFLQKCSDGQIRRIWNRNRCLTPYALSLDVPFLTTTAFNTRNKASRRQLQTNYICIISITGRCGTGIGLKKYLYSHFLVWVFSEPLHYERLTYSEKLNWLKFEMFGETDVDSDWESVVFLML